MGSSIPAAIDWLIGLANQVKAATTDFDLIVHDGWPASLGTTMFAVGADSPPDDTDGQQADGSQDYRDLGARVVDEVYGVPCYIYAAAGGTDQKSCRDRVFTVWDAFFPLLRADLTLGEALANGNNYARITGFNLVGPKSSEEAAKGRYALLKFTVTCQNRY